MALSVVSRRTEVKSEIKATAVMTMIMAKTKTMETNTDCIPKSMSPAKIPIKAYTTATHTKELDICFLLFL